MYKTNIFDIDFDDLPSYEIESPEAYNSPSYETFEYYRMSKLGAIVFDIYKNTIWYTLYDKKKRLPKGLLSEIYYFIREQITDVTYTETELFITIAQCLGVNMSILYEMIGFTYKYELVAVELKKYRPSKFVWC